VHFVANHDWKGFSRLYGIPLSSRRTHVSYDIYVNKPVRVFLPSLIFQKAKKQNDPIIDTDWIEFARLRGVKIPHDSWRMTVKNISAAYEELSGYHTRFTELEDRPQHHRALGFVYATLRNFMCCEELMTFEEVIESCDPTAGSGIGYNHRLQNKGQVCGSPSFWQDLETYCNALESDTPIPDIWLIFQKIELRDLYKILMGKIRTVCSGPFLHYLVLCRYVLGPDRMLTEHWKSHPMAVGMNPNSRHWQDVADFLAGKNLRGLKILIKDGVMYIETDASNWDRSLSSELLWLCAWLRWLCMPYSIISDPKQSVRHQKIFFRLYESMINSYMMCPGGEVFRKYSGLPSGSPTTIYDNCIIHIYIVYSALLAMRPTLTIAQIQQDFRFKVMGDDFIGGFSLKQNPWFNLPAFLAQINLFGIVFKYVHHSFDIFQRTFLSRKWIEKWGILVALADSEKLGCSMAYGNRVRCVVRQLEHMLGLRQDAFTNDKMFALIDSYVAFFIKKHHQKLVAGRPDTTWQSVISRKLTPTAMMLQITSYE